MSGSLWKANFASCRQRQFSRSEKGRIKPKLTNHIVCNGRDTHGGFLQKSCEERRRARESEPVCAGEIDLDSDLARPPKGSTKWNPLIIPWFPQCSTGFILRGFHFLDPLGGLGLDSQSSAGAWLESGESARSAE